MLKFTYSILFITLYITLTLGSVSAQSKKHLDDIIPGMTYYDVLQLWGEPEDKSEYEIKREADWNYDNYVIRFRDGKVLSARRLEPSYAPLLASKLPEVEEKKTEPSKKDVAVSDILSEITQDEDPK